jgi:transmembrane sensor
MTTLNFRSFISSADDQIGEEAAEWLMRFTEVEPDPKDAYSNPAVRDDAFLNWTARSSNHLRMFVKTIDVYQRLGEINPEKLIDMTELLASARSEIQRLNAPVAIVRALRRKYFTGLAAAVVLAVGALLVRDQIAPAPTSYARIGERQTIPLPDGSTITLNTSSQIAVSFDTRQRWVHLISGEALFEVRHDARRPFAVITADARCKSLPSNSRHPVVPARVK